ncbi:hypothetical protein REPUB_Repub06bG0123900 [Reevesia pubescens]
MNFSSLALEPSPVAASRWTTPRRPTLHCHHHRCNFLVFSWKPTASSSLSLAESTASDSLSRIGSLSQVSGVLGSQWGDEGKSKLVDILAQHFDIVSRCLVPL